jgi:hypothetical protein
MNATTGFAPFYGRDRDFFLLMLATLWLGILMGFVPEIIPHVQGLKPPFPAVVHVHAAIFVGWMLLLTTQILLIRTGRVEVHRSLGIIGAMLAGAMIVIGPVTAVVVDSAAFGTKDYDPAFLAIQWGDIINFTPLVAAALVLRNNASAHKRLILLATIFISDAGWARWLGPHFAFAGNGMFGQYLQLYVFDLVLVTILGSYDFVTRGKLHPAFIAGAVYGVTVDLLICWFYTSPWWKPVATMLIGR